MTQKYLQTSLILLIISAGLLGISIGLMGTHKHITLTTDFYGITNFLTADLFSGFASLSFILLSVFAVLSLKNENFVPVLGYALMGSSLIPLISLFGDSMWIASLGGFPAIGSGQGVIKYFALLSMGVLLLKPDIPTRVKAWISLFPVMLVLLWIGGMKFTELEAKGIEVLVQTSPFMGWMYQVWDLQTTSNIIGVYDLLAVALLIAAIYVKSMRIPAIALAGAVFVVTQTFLFSWEAALSSDTLLSTGGHFLIKDIWYIINLLMFWQIVAEQESPSAE